MSETLSDAAAALRRLGGTVGDAGARLSTHDPGGRAFGAECPGAPGDLGRALHAQWLRALDARAREAAAHGARFVAAGDAVARAAGSYAEVDDTARGHHPGAA